ncbi:MAG: hypothetical protein KQH67_01670 [Bacteroidetes bacterium]|nr:hypothetical protein [Bacteroidota bacterium]
MRKFFRFIYRTVIYIFVVLIGMLIAFYLMAPIYEFSGPVKFNGDKLYNPYAKMDSTLWKKYNFQVQSKAWLGITDGRKNSNELIDSIYNALGFDHVATSDYQKINYYGKDKVSFIPTYEHGYNILKTHQVCVDAKKVLWTDLILWQTRSMKQWIIDQLKEDCSIVSLAHPLLRHGYSVEDMRYLTNYDMMEVLNNARLSYDHWDAALSTGNLAWMMGNDDAHDVLNSNHVGRKFTMINAPDMHKETIIQSLKTGNAYGVDFFPKMDVPMDERIELSKNIPYITKVNLTGDTIEVAASQEARTITFIGQEGKVLETYTNTKSATYVVQESDTYVRTVFNYPDNTSLCLNPIVRYSGEQVQSLKTAHVNTRATLYLRVVYFLIFLTIAYFYARRQKNKAVKRN